MAVNVRDAVLQDELEVVQLWRHCGLVASHNDPGSDFRFACAGPASTKEAYAAAGGIPTRPDREEMLIIDPLPRSFIAPIA